MSDRVIYNSPNRITQGYNKSKHKGVDLGWSYNEEHNKVYANSLGTVYSTLDGVPHGSEYGGGWGNYVYIKHPNGMFSRYAHLKNGLFVKNGQTVDENTCLGIMGESGRAYGRHLHYEVSTSASTSGRIDPTPYLTKPIYTESPIYSETVKNIQRTLNERYGTNLIIDGIYGSQTHKAFIIGLQKELNSQFHAGLVVDGIFGQKTKNACRTVSKGARGNITYLIQSKLYVKSYQIIIDSIYGTNTVNQVKKFQSSSGLISDGICGKNTFEKLFK